MSLSTRRLGFDPDLVDYSEALALQRELHQQVLRGETGSTLLLLEHADVYTAGKRTEPQDRPQDGTEVVDVDRGGKITWHGRGQLVGYPILKLQDRALVKDYVCALEGAIISVLQQDYGITAERVEGRSGVWLTDRPVHHKIAAVGIRVHQSVTTHGFALNCSNDLRPFANIIPCGIADAGTTSISSELGRQVTPADVVESIEQQLMSALPRFISTEERAGAHPGEAASVACTNSESKKGALG